MNTKQNVIRPFRSLLEALYKAEEKSSVPFLGDESERPPRAWSGGLSKAETIKTAMTGWPEGLNKIKMAVEKMQVDLMLPVPVQYIEHDVVGAAPDVGAYLRGEPEDMLVFMEEPNIQRSRYAKIQFEGAVHCGYSDTQLFHTGAALAAALMMLQAEGVTTEIIHTMTLQNWSDRRFWQSQIPLPRDLDSLAFCLTHPGMLRRVGFGLMEKENEETRRAFSFHTGGTYSCPRELLIEGVDLCFTMQRYCCNTIEDSKRVALQIVKEINDAGK